MSIINQMLKDLEDRKESAIKGQDGIISRPLGATHRSRAPLILLSLLSGGLLVVVLYLLWQPQPELIDSEPATTMVPAQSTTTTIASLLSEEEPPQPESSATSQPSPKRANSTTRVVIAPRPVKAVEEPAAAAVATAPPLQSVSISAVSPAELVGSWQRQRLTVTGKNFTPDSQLLLCWPAKCVTLKGYRITYISPTELSFEFTAGIKEERWHLTVLNPNGQASNAIEFIVRAPATINQRTATEERTFEDEAETFGGVSKRVIPLTAYQQAEAYYLEANQNNYNPSKAISLWERAILLAPEHHASRQSLIDHLISNGRIVEAEGYALQALKLFPNYPLYHQRLAQIRISQDNHGAALTLIEEAIGNGIASAELYALGATLYQRDRKFTQSIESYQRALTLKPENGVWWMGLGITFEQSGRFGESVSAYQQALNSGTLSNKLRSYVEGQISLNQQRLKKGAAN